MEQLYKVGSESELNSWSDRSVGQERLNGIQGLGFNTNSGQLSIAISKTSSYKYIIYRQIDRQIDRQLDRQIDKQIDRYRYRYRYIDIQIYIHINIYIYRNLNLPINTKVRLPQNRSRHSHDQEMFLESSDDKQTRNYDTEC